MAATICISNIIGIPIGILSVMIEYLPADEVYFVSKLTSIRKPMTQQVVNCIVAKPLNTIGFDELKRVKFKFDHDETCRYALQSGCINNVKSVYQGGIVRLKTNESYVIGELYNTQPDLDWIINHFEGNYDEIVHGAINTNNLTAFPILMNIAKINNIIIDPDAIIQSFVVAWDRIKTNSFNYLKYICSYDPSIACACIIKLVEFTGVVYGKSESKTESKTEIKTFEDAIASLSSCGLSRNQLIADIITLDCVELLPELNVRSWRPHLEDAIRSQNHGMYSRTLEWIHNAEERLHGTNINMWDDLLIEACPYSEAFAEIAYLVRQHGYSIDWIYLWKIGLETEHLHIFETLLNLLGSDDWYVFNVNKLAKWGITNDLLHHMAFLPFDKLNLIELEALADGHPEALAIIREHME